MNKKKVWSENLYLVAYTMWLMCAIINITMWRDIHVVMLFCRYTQRFCYLLLIVRFFLIKRYSYKDIIGIFLILYCLLLSEHSVYNAQIIPAAIFVCCCGNVRFDKILKATFVVQMCVMAVTIVASQTGIIEDVIWSEGERIRHSLGYKYCGYPAHIFLFITLMWFCIRKQAKILEAICFLILNFIIYKYTDSRTDFYLAVVGIAGFFVWAKTYSFKFILELRNFIIKYMFAFIAIVSVSIQLLYQPENSWMLRLNEWLNGRLQLGHNAIEQYGFSLFGEAVRWIGQGSLKSDPALIYNYVDCAYLKEIISYGLVFMMLLCVGYYFAGVRMIKNRQYALSWAVFISLLYSVINAHLLVLAFNVFFLVQGSLFDTDSGQECAQFCDVLINIADKWKEKLQKKNGCASFSWFRKVLFLLILLYLVWIQYDGLNTISKNAGFHQWMICMALLCISLLCCAAAKKNGNDYFIGSGISKLAFWGIVFLSLACVSDFFINKRFQYSAFGMLLFGGLFIHCWGRMERPHMLVMEFKWAYKVWFIALAITGAVLRPPMEGICYSGMFIDAGTLGVAAIVAAVVFMDSGLKKRLGICDSIGVAISIYLLWTTQYFVLIMIGGVVIAFYVAYRLVHAVKLGECKKAEGIFYGFGILMACVGAMLLLRMFLYQISPELGINLVFEKDRREYIEYPVLQSLQNGTWRLALADSAEILATYLKQLNLFGHKYLAVFMGKKIWPDNSLVMNLYRYGVLAGMSYAVFLIVYLCRAFHHMICRQDFFPAGIGIACVGIAMVEAIEMPFAHIGWFVCYLFASYLVVLDKEEGRKKRFYEMENKEDSMRFLNTELTNVTFDEALKKISDLVDEKKGGYVVTPNVDHIVRLEQDEDFRCAYGQASMVLTDGQPLIWISKLFKTPIKEKISGSDLFPRLCNLAAKRGYRMYLLGAAEGVAEMAAKRLTKKNPGLCISGTFSPPYGFEKDAGQVAEVWERIHAVEPDILIVGLGTPKQELFLWKNQKELGGILAFGLGASIDFEAGNIKRAPHWMQKSGLEWFYRLCLEPRRLFKRYLIDDMKIIPLVWKYRKRQENENSN